VRHLDRLYPGVKRIPTDVAGMVFWLYGIILLTGLRVVLQSFPNLLESSSAFVQGVGVCSGRPGIHVKLPGGLGNGSVCSWARGDGRGCSGSRSVAFHGVAPLRPVLVSGLLPAVSLGLQPLFSRAAEGAARVPALHVPGRALFDRGLGGPGRTDDVPQQRRESPPGRSGNLRD